MSPVLVVPGQPWTCPGFAARFAVPRATRAGDGASPGRSRWCCLQRNPALLISLQNLTRLCCSTRACVCMCADKNLYRSCFPDSPSDWQQNKLPFPSPHTLSAADKTWARRRAADSTARKELPYPESCPDLALFSPGQVPPAHRGRGAGCHGVCWGPADCGGTDPVVLMGCRWEMCYSWGCCACGGRRWGPRHRAVPRRDSTGCAPRGGG